MTSLHIRPRFRTVYDLTPAELESRIREQAAEKDCPVIASVIPGFIVLKPLPSEQHFWSPQLSLSFEKDEESDRTIVRGLYGPNPTVWAIFAFGYGTLSILALFVALYGFSQYSLGQDARVLWLLHVLAISALVLYVVAQIGQKLGAEQTFLLHHFLERSIGHRIHLE